MNSLVPEPIQSNILIVDDNPANLRLLIDILGREGYQVRPVPSGKLAFAAAKGFPPDLILLDIMMPDVDGYQVCRELKADPITREIPVIFISAINESIDKAKAFQVGAVDYITKPFQIDEVLVRVNTHLKIGSLQKIVDRQNRQLTETMQALEATRERFNQREKTVDRERPISEIVNEIDSPMDEIRSSVENLSIFFEENLTGLPTFFQSISPEHQEYAIQLIRNNSHISGEHSIEEKQQFKQNLIGELESLGLEKADTLAGKLVDLGILDRADLTPFLPLLSDSSAERTIDIAHQLTTLKTHTETIKTAAEKATNLLRDLREDSR